jgi:hypothetical protein
MLTVGLSRAVAGEQVWPSIVAGGLGGATAFAGKRLVSDNSNYTVLAGRQLSALGASMVANAGTGKAPLSRVVFPYGPLRIYFTDSSTRRVRIKLDIAGVGAALYLATRDGNHMDWAKTLKAGIPVVLVDSLAPPTDLGGWHVAGVVRLRTASPFMTLEPSTAHLAMGHEFVHVAQYDFSFIAWTARPEAALLRVLPGGNTIGRFVDLGLNAPAWSIANGLIPYESRPWEQEASILAGR